MTCSGLTPEQDSPRVRAFLFVFVGLFWPQGTEWSIYPPEFPTLRGVFRLGWGEWVGGWEPVNPTVWWAGKTQVEYPFGQLGGGPRPKIFKKNNSLKARKAETMGDESHFCIPFDTKLWKNLRENILSLILQFWHILFSSCKSILDDNVLVISCLLAKDWAKPHRLFGNNGNPLQYPGTLKKQFLIVAW